MTNEEKMVLMEQQALAAQEEGEKRMELASKFLKEKLEQEEKNTRISVSKLNQQWRQIMRKVKAEQLRKELEILNQSFERMLDRKNATVTALAVDLDEASQQSHMALQAHLQKVDQLISFQEQLVQQVHEEFNAELQELKDEFMGERSEIIRQHEKETNDIKDIMFVMKMLHDDQEAEMAGDLMNKTDDIRTKNLEARSALKSNLESTIGDLWELFQQALKNYEHSTADKKADFDRLKERDRKSAVNIELHNRKLNRLQEKIQMCKQSLANSQKESEQQNKALKQEKETILLQFQHLKDQMSLSRDGAREQLTALTLKSKRF